MNTVPYQHGGQSIHLVGHVASKRINEAETDITLLIKLPAANKLMTNNNKYFASHGAMDSLLQIWTQ